RLSRHCSVVCLAASGVRSLSLHDALPIFYRDGEIVYTASSMPIRDQETFLPAGPAAARFLANRGANGIDGLVSSGIGAAAATGRSEEHTSELQSHLNLVCRPLLEKKNPTP